MSVGYVDDWVSASGGYFASIEGDDGGSGQDSLPGRGSAVVRIERSGPEILLWWNDEVIRVGESSRTVINIAIELSYYAYNGQDGPSFFGTESIGQAQGGSRAGREGGASRAVGALIATSMQRRAVRSMTWSLPIARRDKP